MPRIKYYDQYKYLDAVAKTFSDKLNEKHQFEHPIDLSGYIDWRGDTSKGYGKDEVEDCRKTLMYLLSFCKMYTDTLGLDNDERPKWFKSFIHTEYEKLLPLIESAEKEVGFDMETFMSSSN